MMVRRKRIYLNKDRTRFCTVKLYKTKLMMQEAYKKAKPLASGHYKCIGVHMAYFKLFFKDKKWKLHPETGTVFLSIEDCGAGIVCHELGHAVLWADKYRKGKKQYPIVLKDMKDEERVLHNLTFAIMQFYVWYWKIIKTFKK